MKFTQVYPNDIPIDASVISAQCPSAIRLHRVYVYPAVFNALRQEKMRGWLIEIQTVYGF